jgi:glycosyltransferase involved in cell wall biosynthesis
MTAGRGSILIDARVNALPGAHGLARSVTQLAAHAGPDGHEGTDSGAGVRLQVLVNPQRPQLFPLAGLARHAEIIGTDITLGAVHRSRQLARLIRRTGASVLYAPYPLFSPLLCPCPLVVTIHDCTMENDAGFAGGRLRQAGLKVVTRAVLRRAAAVTTPTQASLAEIRFHYPAARHLTLVPNGVDQQPYARVSDYAVAAARRQYRLPRRYVLAVGAHRPHKNHEILLRALASLPADVSLVIVGPADPRFASGVPAQIGKLGLCGRVLLLPEVADGLLPAVYRAAAVVALPSLAEGYGLPALEAMAAGVPVVVSDIPVLAEVCGRAAALVPPRDPAAWAAAIMKILDDPGAADRMVRAGAAIAAQATWDRGGRALRELLLSVAAAATCS